MDAQFRLAVRAPGPWHAPCSLDARRLRGHGSVTDGIESLPYFASENQRGSYDKILIVSNGLFARRARRNEAGAPTAIAAFDLRNLEEAFGGSMKSRAGTGPREVAGNAAWCCLPQFPCRSCARLKFKK